MYQKILQGLKAWAVLLIGAPLILGGLYLASPEPSPPPLTLVATETGADDQAAKVTQEQALSESGQNTAQPSAEEASTEAPPASEETAGAVQAVSPPGGSAQNGSGQVVAQNSGDAPPAQAGVAGDPANGEQVFKKCRACHTVEPGKNTVGPSLAGVFGRKAGEVPNYNYSPALKNANIVWDAAALHDYLLDPKGFLPGNKMAFPGLKKEEERSNVIAYLAARSSSQAGQSAQAGAPTQADVQQPQAEAPTQADAQQPQAVTSPAQQQVQVQQQSGQEVTQETQTSPGAAAAPGSEPAQQQAETTPAAPTDRPSVSYIPDVRYTLRSGIAEGRMVFIGEGGTIDNQVNPVLSAAEGQVVQITLLNGEGAEHDIVFPDFNAKSPRIVGRGSSTTLVFRAERIGDFLYICSVPGHQLAGMQGQFVVTPRPATPSPVEADISQRPTDVPPPIGNREPQRLRVDLLTVELEGRLAEGTTFGYWTFNGRVQGP